MLLWTLMYKFLCRHIFLILLYICQGVIAQYLTYYESAKLFSTLAILFCLPTSNVRWFHFLPATLVVSLFFILVILVCMKWYLIMVLICIFLINNNAYLSICLLTTYISSLKNCLLKSLVHFKTEIISFLFLNCKSYLCILDTNLLSDIWYDSIFSHFVVCLFHLLTMSFEAQKLLILSNLIHLFFLLLLMIFVSFLRNIYLIRDYKIYDYILNSVIYFYFLH